MRDSWKTAVGPPVHTRPTMSNGEGKRIEYWAEYDVTVCGLMKANVRKGGQTKNWRFPALGWGRAPDHTRFHAGSRLQTCLKPCNKMIRIVYTVYIYIRIITILAM